MFRRLRSGPARWAATATAALTLASAGLLVVASPAQAEPFPFTDGFEGTPTDRWVADVVAGQSAVRLGNDARARSGTKLALLDSGVLTPARARIYRTVTPDIADMSCSMSLSTRRVTNPLPPDPEAVEVSVKIRSGGPNGQIIFAEGRSVYATTGWEQRWNTGNFYQTGTFTIDIAAIHGIALIDDVAFTCPGYS
jgi:hypothetical protein